MSYGAPPTPITPETPETPETPTNIATTGHTGITPTLGTIQQKVDTINTTVSGIKQNLNTVEQLAIKEYPVIKQDVINKIHTIEQKAEHLETVAVTTTVIILALLVIILLLLIYVAVRKPRL